MNSNRRRPRTECAALCGEVSAARCTAGCTKTARQRPKTQRGMAAVELTLLAPVLLIILLFIVGLGRMAHARQQVEAAASDAARAASLERTQSAARGSAATAAQQSLGSTGVSCQHLDLNVNLSSYEPGGVIVVTVACRAPLTDVAITGLPGSRTFTATATVPIETYRAR